VNISPSYGSSGWRPQSYGSRAARSYTPPPVPETSADDLRLIETGTARSEVVEKLGTPVARVTIPEGGRFLEVYYYQARGETIGAVRLDDGAVTEVQLAR
jgi:hypothetical protein